MRHTLRISPLLLAMAGAIGLVATPLSALAQSDIEQARATMSRLISTLAEQGVLARDKADGLLKEVAAPPASASSSKTAANGTGAGNTVRVGYVPQFVRDELKRELRAELAEQAKTEGWAGPGAVPSWTRGIEVDGDVRTRYQADRFASGNAPATGISESNRNRVQTLTNTTEDRDRLRVRARVAVTATLDENWSAGARLSTGSTTDPLSANQTLGNYNARFVTVFDRAYVRWRYGDQFNAVAGRFGNPWFGTDLVWANDLGFDGGAFQWTPKLGNIGKAFVTVAAMPVQEVELSSVDKWLFGLQVGAEAPKLFGAVAAKFGVGYYAYTNTLGVASPPGSTRNEFTAPAFAQKGNTYYNISSEPLRPLLGLAADYKLINLTGSMSMAVLGDKRLTLSGDYVKNIGFKRSAVSQRVGLDVQAQTMGYQLRAAFGHADVARFGAWQVFAAYKHLERDAVPDAFTDSDFRLGGTDAKGYILGGSFGLGKNTSLGLRVLSADSITGPPLGIDVMQVDLNVRF